MYFLPVLLTYGILMLQTSIRNNNICSGAIFKRDTQGSSGFTIVQTLIVLAIIVVLATVALTGIIGNTELNQVQTAMDSMMLEKKLAAVTAVTIPTNDMSKFPDAANPLYPNFFRNAQTRGLYTCSNTGQVSQVIYP